MKTYRRF